jgi:hypothetical protein
MLFLTRLLAQRLTSCFGAQPSSFITALYDRRPSVVIVSTLPWHFIAFLMKVRAADLSRVLVT